MPYEIERKFLISRPDLLNLANLCKIKKISQTYLVSAEGSLRVRRTEEKGKVTYVETSKRSISAMKRLELEQQLTEEEYNRRLESRDPRRRTIQKTRYCLPYAGHTYEIDIYPFWKKQAVMEVELSEEEEAFTPPPFIRILKEVTGDPRYSNHSLAREIPEEETI
ncbi:MAG: CYTH domain-containing protein [Clostridia bacterium]|nr:CYTH domain-containing protein [Clostridia bacterium]